MAAISSAHPAIRKETRRTIQVQASTRAELEVPGVPVDSMGSSRLDISPGQRSDRWLERSRLWFTLTRVMPVNSQHAMGQSFLQAIPRALTADHAKACSDPVQQMDSLE